MIYIDPMKIPRPERSGYIAILVAYTLLWLWGYNLMPHDFSDNIKDFSVKCWIAQWSCPKESQSLETKKEIERDYHVVMLSPYGISKKKICTCHVDVHYFGKPIQHVHMKYEQECGTKDLWLSKEWETFHCPPTSFTFEGKRYDNMNGCAMAIQALDGYMYEVKDGEAETRFPLRVKKYEASTDQVFKHSQRGLRERRARARVHQHSYIPLLRSARGSLESVPGNRQQGRLFRRAHPRPIQV